MGFNRQAPLDQLSVGYLQRIFFDGTIQLNSGDHEDAALVAGLLEQSMIRNGVLAVVQGLH